MKSLVWHRLEDAYLFTWGYFGYHVFSMFMMRLFLNANVFFSHFDFWLGMMVLENLFIFGIYFLAKKFVRVTPAWLVLGSALAIGAARTAMTTALAIPVGLDAGIDWAFQLSTGALFEALMVGVWANVNGAYRDHRKVVDEINAARNTILGYRENAEEILAEEQEKLLKLTSDSLLPQIKLIEKAIQEGNLEITNRWSVAQELKALINNQVRPLSETLRNSAKALISPAPKTKGYVISILSIPSPFRITNSIFPRTTSLLIALGFISAPLWILDEVWAFISGGLVVTYYAVLFGLKKLTANWPPLNAWLGVPLLIVFSLIPVVPAYTFAVIFYPDISKAVLYGVTTSAISLIVIMSLAILDSFDYQSRAYSQLLTEQNKELSLEMTLFEQQVWAARKNWSLVVHGTVQAALTAALTRLNSPDANEKTLDLAKKDLDRAITALTSAPAPELKFQPALRELISTWQGVCEIEVVIQSDLKKIIAKDARLSMCVNEILKEAISNAVRHGDARMANVEMKLNDSGLIEMLVTNDGTAPKANSRKGLGSSLLDELTLSWKLYTDPNRNKTALWITLPYSKTSA